VSPQGSYVQYYIRCKDDKVFEVSGVQSRSLTIICTVVNGQAMYSGGSSSTSIQAPDCQGGSSAILEDCDKAVTDSAVKFIAAVPGAQVPNATTCGETMKSDDTCVAVCQAGEPVAGQIVCFNGTMLGGSFCGTSDYQAAESSSVLGTLILHVRGNIDTARLQRSLANYLGVPLDNVRVVMRSASTARRLSAHTSVLFFVEYLSNYEIVVPDNSTEDPIKQKMLDLNIGASSSSGSANNSKLFTQELAKEGIDSDGDFTASAQTKLVTVWEQDGQQVIPSIPAQSNPIMVTTTVEVFYPAPVPVPAPAPGDSNTSYVAGIVGAVIGGVTGLLLICGSIYFCMSREKLAEV